MFQTRNPEYIRNTYDDKEFLEVLGRYRREKKRKLRLISDGTTELPMVELGKTISLIFLQKFRRN